MARTKIIPPEGLLSDLEYTSVIVSYSNGIDSTGALYWAVKNFPKEKIYLLYCDTGCEYPENVSLFYKVAAFMGVKPVFLSDTRGFLGLLLNERLKFPDMKNRWCTAYLKTAVTDKWIRQNRQQLGTKCLFLSGERRDESTGRAKLRLKLAIAVQAYSGTLVQFQQGGFGSRHGEPAPEGSRLIAVSGYRDKNSSGHTS